MQLVKVVGMLLLLYMPWEFQKQLTLARVFNTLALTQATRTNSTMLPRQNVRPTLPNAAASKGHEHLSLSHNLELAHQLTAIFEGEGMRIPSLPSLCCHHYTVEQCSPVLTFTGLAYSLSAGTAL